MATRKRKASAVAAAKAMAASSTKSFTQSTLDSPPRPAKKQHIDGELEYETDTNLITVDGATKLEETKVIGQRQYLVRGNVAFTAAEFDKLWKSRSTKGITKTLNIQFNHLDSVKVQIRAGYCRCGNSTSNIAHSSLRALLACDYVQFDVLCETKSEGLQQPTYFAVFKTAPSDLKDIVPTKYENVIQPTTVYIGNGTPELGHTFNFLVAMMRPYTGPTTVHRLWQVLKAGTSTGEVTLKASDGTWNVPRVMLDSFLPHAYHALRSGMRGGDDEKHPTIDVSSHKLVVIQAVVKCAMTNLTPDVSNWTLEDIASSFFLADQWLMREDPADNQSLHLPAYDTLEMAILDNVTTRPFESFAAKGAFWDAVAKLAKTHNRINIAAHFEHLQTTAAIHPAVAAPAAAAVQPVDAPDADGPQLKNNGKAEMEQDAMM